MEIEGSQAVPKGLRHHFGALAIVRKIPETALKRWLGHAKMSPTSMRRVQKIERWRVACGAERELSRIFRSKRVRRSFVRL